MLQLKIPQSLYNSVCIDLKRPHKFAYERIGFLYVRKCMEGSRVAQVIACGYSPVSDENYIEDEEVGAKINSSAIRDVMQRVLSTGEGALHVHMHNHIGKPRLSKTDAINLKKLIPSFQLVCPSSPHGALILSPNSMISLLWLPGQKFPTDVDKITIVGYPMGIYVR